MYEDSFDNIRKLTISQSDSQLKCMNKSSVYIAIRNMRIDAFSVTSPIANKSVQVTLKT